MSDHSLSLISVPHTQVPYKAVPFVFENSPALRVAGSSARIAIVGNHLPRQCGIATFTTDLCDAVALQHGAAGVFVVAVNDSQSPYSYPARVRCEITEDAPSSYRGAAEFLNSSNVDLVCLQHEYGIFGGKAGSHVLQLLQRLKMPVVTTLHTVLREPDVDQLAVMQEIAARSARLIVMSRHALSFLQDIFKVPTGKIDRIPTAFRTCLYGVAYIQGFVFHQRKDRITYIRPVVPKQGIRERDRSPAAHSDRPQRCRLCHCRRHPPARPTPRGDRYLLELKALAKALGVEQHVVFVNRFVNPQEMASLVGLADIYVTPYRHETQAVSGTLAYALGAGKAIISTPYWHATELLEDGRGVLVPFNDVLRHCRRDN